MKKITIVTNYFNSFKCLSSDCPATCCHQWIIGIDNETYDKYLLINDDFKFFLSDNISPETKNINLNKGFCPFLDENKLCKIQLRYGHDYLCNTCKNFPKDTINYKEIERKDLLLSCPAVVNIINNLKNFEEIIVYENKSLTNKTCIKYYNLLSNFFLTLQKSNFNLKQNLLLIYKTFNNLDKSTLNNFNQTCNNQYFKLKIKNLKLKKVDSTTFNLFDCLISFYQNFRTNNKDIINLIKKYNDIDLRDKKSKKQYKKFIKKMNKQINIKNILFYLNKFTIVEALSKNTLKNFTSTIFFILSIILFCFLDYFNTKNYNYSQFISVISNVFRVCYHSNSFNNSIKTFPDYLKENNISYEEILKDIFI